MSFPALKTCCTSMRIENGADEAKATEFPGGKFGPKSKPRKVSMLVAESIPVFDADSGAVDEIGLDNEEGPVGLDGWIMRSLGKPNEPSHSNGSAAEVDNKPPPRPTPCELEREMRELQKKGMQRRKEEEMQQQKPCESQPIQDISSSVAWQWPLRDDSGADSLIQAPERVQRNSLLNRSSSLLTMKDGLVSALPGSSGLRIKVVERLRELFNKMDEDGNRSITKEEAMNFWSSNFGKINATAMFNEVDADCNGYVTWEEFLQFWENVKKSGYSQQDILEEVESMLKGGSWVDWNDGRSTDKPGCGSSPTRRAVMKNISTWLQKLILMTRYSLLSGGDLKQKTKDRVKAMFESMDCDRNGSVTKEKAMSFWGKNFAKANAEAMFSEVDEDGHGLITYDQFIDFWRQVKRSGYSDDEIFQEIGSMISQRSSWVDWNDGRSTEKPLPNRSICP